MADAYYAFINKKYLANDEAEKKVDMSKFMAPVVVDSSGNISTTTKLEQMVLGKNGTEVVTRDDQRSGFVFNPATEKIEKSNEITVRVKTGDRTAHEHDHEDSFQLYVKYSPPEKEEETAVGTGSDFQIPILALGLGLLRDDQKAEFDVGDLHMEAEASGDYQLRIKTSQDGITFSESGNTLDIGVKSFADSVEDIVNNIESDRFQASGNGSLNIDKVEWNIGGLKIEATIPDATDPSEYDKRSLNIILLRNGVRMVIGLKMRKLKLPTKLMVQSNIM